MKHTQAHFTVQILNIIIIIITDTYTHTHTHAHTHTHTHAHVHKQIHTHTYTYTRTYTAKIIRNNNKRNCIVRNRGLFPTDNFRRIPDPFGGEQKESSEDRKR